MKNTIKLSSSALLALVLSGCSYSSDALFPSLLGDDTQEAIVSSEEKGKDVVGLGTTNFEPVSISEGSNTGTFVGQKVATFRGELSQLQKSISSSNETLQKIRASVINNALQYHKVVGMIEAKLQVGTTPGNPHMFQMLQAAQNNIQVMNANTNALSQLSSKVSSDAAMTSYLLDSIKAAYSVSGAVDEDHRQLRILENETNQTSITINSLLAEVNGDVARQQQYIDTAKNYIVDLNQAIKVGSYGVGNAPLISSSVSAVRPTYAGNAVTSNSKPLFVAKFNKSNVNYKKGLKQAISSAVSKKPNVAFDVVAVSPVNGSQLSATNARNHATTIFQDMIEMGIGADKISLSSKANSNATSSEVHVYVR